MSPRNSEDAPVGLYRKPRTDLYTVMLVVALMALICATIFLYVESTITGPTPQGAPSVQTGMLWNKPDAGLLCTTNHGCLFGDTRFRSWGLGLWS